VELTIPGALARAAKQFAAAEAIAEPGGPRLTYAELRERVREVAAGLVAEGIEAGDRVAIWSPNTHHWVLAGLGALYAGATLVPVNTRFTGPEALDVISRSGATALIVAGPFLGTDRLTALVDAAIAEPADDRGLMSCLRLIVRVPVDLDEHVGDFAVARATANFPMWTPTVLEWSELASHGTGPDHIRAADQRAEAVKPDQVSDILFTSGTTGRSKGAMSSHLQALDVARAWAECGEVGQADRYLVVNPFFHSFGYKAGILVCLLTGATIVPQLIYDPAESMRLIAAERITVFPGVPTIYQTILDHQDRDSLDLSSLRLAVTGAATVPVALVERMQAELSFDIVLTAYGLTEAVVVTMCRPGDDPKIVATTSGRATAGFEVRLDDKTGEILLRGPNVMLGYLDDPEETSKAIDADGWLHTGDVGQLDDQGYLVITDRLKDMYICGGFNVYPAEVEQVLARLDGVAESAVIGVPDERLGEVGKAFVVTRPGYQITADGVARHCRERLANYKVPRQVEFRASLPRNLSGKTLKRLLREESQ
jgi:HIP---CoA ligase